MVASDRISAFDVVMAEPIPDKGRVLTGLTKFWLDELADVAPSHLVSSDRRGAATTGRAGPWWCARPTCSPSSASCAATSRARRGRSTQAHGTMHGAPLPAGLRRVRAAARAAVHPVDQGRAGPPRREHLLRAGRRPRRRRRRRAPPPPSPSRPTGGRAARAAERGIIIADTKFELGFIDGELAICDEVLTPDSSRFWEASAWEPGTTPPSFDKQPVRDWLEATGWDKTPPPPALPPDVVVHHVAPATSPPTSASPASRSPTGRVPGSPTVTTFPVLVEVRLRPDVADPQGATIERSLPTLGFARGHRRAGRQGHPLHHGGARRGHRRGPGPRSCAAGSSPTR